MCEARPEEEAADDRCKAGEEEGEEVRGAEVCRDLPIFTSGGRGGECE